MEEKEIDKQIKEFLKQHPEISKKLKDHSKQSDNDDDSDIISSLTDLFGEVTSGLIGF